MGFLEEAMATGRRAAEERARRVPASQLEARLASAGDVPPFREAISRNGGPIKVIAEVKLRSPSAGEINRQASITRTAGAFEAAGAAAVSVLTSEFGFAGSVDYLAEAGSGCDIPLLCKDFVSLPYQVIEARTLGASAVLLIADALDRARIEELGRAAGDLGMDALIEAHGRAALERALDAGARIVGINNRDLQTLSVDLAVTERLAGLVPGGVTLVSESGIRTSEDVRRIDALGVDAMLIGEALMRAADPRSRLRRMLDVKKGPGDRLARGMDRCEAAGAQRAHGPGSIANGGDRHVGEDLRDHTT